MAACLNGVKGEANTLNKKRGRKDAIHSSLDAARMDRKTLDAMLSAMRDSFPMFRKYFNAKAKKIGKEKLAWWDIFAPVGRTAKVYSFEEARDFILENFGKFSPELAPLPNAPSITTGSTPSSAKASAAAHSAWKCRA